MISLNHPEIFPGHISVKFYDTGNAYFGKYYYKRDYEYDVFETGWEFAVLDKTKYIDDVKEYFKNDKEFCDFLDEVK